jgi:vancomycin resistance protein VanW
MKNDIKKRIAFIEIVFTVTFLIYSNFSFIGYALTKQTLSFLPMRSGPLTKLPWAKDKKFLKAKKTNNTPILMAAYKTVLLDPSPGEEYNVHLSARLLCGTIVKSKHTFSQNKTVGPYTNSKGYRKGPTYTVGKVIKTTGGGVCKLATTLYNVAILSNLVITKRYYHSMPVSYVPYGQDATVSYGTHDFKFKNNTSFPIMIWSKGIGDTLYIGFYGRKLSPKVTWNHKVLSVKKTKTIYKKNPKLRHGKRKIIIYGMDGKKVKSWVKIRYPNGKVQIKQLGISKYKPLPYVILIGK